MTASMGESKPLGIYKIRLVGGGLGISIPQRFVDDQRWKRGMYVRLIQEDNKLLVVLIKEE